MQYQLRVMLVARRKNKKLTTRPCTATDSTKTE